MTSPSHPQSPTPAESLRDARLAHALQHMPDAHMQPSAQTRHAVLQEALRVASTPSPNEKRRWWHAWLGKPGQRLPWSAALASLAVVGFITVLWYGQDVPDAAAPSAATATDTTPLRSAALSKERTVPAANTSKAKPAELAKDARPQAHEAEALGASERAAPPSAPAMASAPAKALVYAGPSLTITQGDVKRSIAPEKAQALLNLLRGLTYGVVPDLAYREESSADFVMEIAGQERWVIAPDTVRYQSHIARAKGGSSDITPAQYADLRRLALESTVQP